MNIKELITGFFDAAQYKITSLAGYYKLTNKEKKERLDEYITQYFNDVIEIAGLNFVFKWVIKKLVVENIPTITQAIFDLIKARVDGVTQIWTKDAAVPKEVI